MSTARTVTPGLLDDGLLTGQYEVSTLLRPERCARLVESSSVEEVRKSIERASQVWGGGSQPLVPVVSGSIPEPYLGLLEVEQVDLVAGPETVEVSLPPRVRRSTPAEHPSLAVAATQRKAEWRAVQIVDLDSDDPWRPIYEAILGWWPEFPDKELSEWAGLRDGLRFDDVVPVERESVRGSLDDLVGRLLDREVVSPRIVSNFGLAYGLLPDTSYLGVHGLVTTSAAVRRAAGPNLIVAVAPGSAEDVALLWNLRGAHGDGRALPVGVPVDEINSEVLTELQTPGRATMFGLGGGKCHLTSATVPISRLEELAAGVASVKVVPYETVLTFGPAPGRPRSHIVTWKDGTAWIDPTTESDDELLRISRGLRMPPHLILDAAVDDVPIPANGTMRGVEYFVQFQAGSAQVGVSDLRTRRTVRVDWPSTWTCLAAVAQSRNLAVAESAPGLAAATLIRSLGEIDQVRWLLDAPLVALLYEMAEVSGMSWWKKRWAATHAKLIELGVDEGAIQEAALELGRDDPVVAPPGEGRAVGFERFRNVLGAGGARNWIEWAEQRHLIVRGAEVACGDCKTTTWLPLSALPPPVPCPGCGRLIERPYPPDVLSFTYRLGEVLRRVLESDSLGHVYALRWLVELFERHGLVGAHPGVTFADLAEPGKIIGEADVILLFSDGSIAAVEVKRTMAGVDDGLTESMNRLAESPRVS